MCDGHSSAGEGTFLDALAQQGKGPGKYLILLLKGGDQGVGGGVSCALQKGENLGSQKGLAWISPALIADP